MEGKKVFKNATWIISVRIVQAILNMVISMLTARYLGPSNFGIINYAASIVAFFVPLMNLGLGNIMVQQIVMEPEDEGKALGSALTSCFICGTLSVLGVFAFTSIANHGEKETIIVCLLYSVSLITEAFEILMYWFQAKLLSKYTSLITLCSFLVVSAYKVFLLVSGKSVRWFAITYALDYLIYGVGILIYYKKLGGKKLEFDWKLLKRMVGKSKYYILSGLMISVFAQTDRVMLNLMIDETATGLYSAAAACAAMTSFIFAAIIDSLRPMIFESLKTSEEEFKLNMSRLYSIVIYFALAQCIGITIFAKPIMYILYGLEYMAAVPVLRLVVWYSTFSYLGAVRNIWMLAKGKERLIWIIDLSGAIANVFLNVVLISTMGIMGAALASLLTQMFANVVMGFILKEVRPNNTIMMKSLNPRIINDMIKSIIGERRIK